MHDCVKSSYTCTGYFTEQNCDILLVVIYTDANFNQQVITIVLVHV